MRAGEGMGGNMIEFFTESSNQVEVPAWVKDLASFRRWARSDEFPEEGRICFLKGKVWIDMSWEQLFSHVAVKTVVAGVLSQLVNTDDIGIFLGDGARFSSVDADISCKPDATFISHAALADRVRLIEGKRHGYIELEGSPDMVLEVVSDSSVDKDTEVLHRAYWEAGVREYWLIDARKEPLAFDVFRHGAKGFRAARKKDGWMESGVFGKAFRLTVGTGRSGHPHYRLEVR
jgi:Uma2 family endonuclease